MGEEDLSLGLRVMGRGGCSEGACWFGVWGWIGLCGAFLIEGLFVWWVERDSVQLGDLDFVLV